jgi:imidazolonepropionase-like amidohydrolase
LQTGSNRYDGLSSKKKEGHGLTEEEERSLNDLEYKFQRKFENLMRIRKMGVKVVAGSDSTGIGTSTRLLRTMEMLVDAGMSPLEVIASATGTAAEAFKMESLFGTIRVGLKADIISVIGSPENNISDLRNLTFCMKDGIIVRN